MKRPFASLLGILFVTGSMASPLSELRELGQLGDPRFDTDRYDRRGVEREYDRRRTTRRVRDVNTSRHVLDANTSCAVAKIEHGTQPNRTRTGDISTSIQRRLEESPIAGAHGK